MIVVVLIFFSKNYHHHQLCGFILWNHMMNLYVCMYIYTYVLVGR